MISIRKYQPKDKENLRKICIETSRLPKATLEQREFLTVAFNDYYTENEPDNIFVAVNEDDEAVGYILCSENFYDFYDTMKKFYLPAIKELGMSYYISALGEILTHKAFSKKYPAHLHIDILDVCQGQGVGTRLMNELKAHLKSKKINNVMLSCGMSNKQAVKFYLKNDFKIIKNIFGSAIMASEF
ncbi:MAG: GNAT family N-acetyltransferase [Clostridia bacterium]|nr:GNAT family N-acetyltransferase [Clostridia bacterium]